MKEQTIIYMGKEFPMFHSKTPQTFGNEGKLMVVRNDGGSCFQKEVIAYVPSFDFPVIAKDGQYRYCAELPEGSVIKNEYLDSLSLQKGQICIITDTSFPNILESLCKITLDAAKSDRKVFFISSQTNVYDLFERLKNMADFPLDKNPIYLKNGWKSMSPDEVKQAIKKLETSKEHPRLDMLVIDSLESTLSPYRTRKDSLIGLKNLAKEKNIAVITAEQIM